MGQPMEVQVLFRPFCFASSALGGGRFAGIGGMKDRYIVYILISRKDPMRYYIGVTDNLDRRLEEHNKAESGYSKRYAPWFVKTYIVFDSAQQAGSFEKYLKSGSGHAFLKKRFV